MKIIIVGAGTVGFNLAVHLMHKKHTIAIIEQDPGLCDEIKNKLDVFMVAGIGSSPAALEQAGINSADMIIAVTPIDEINLLACHFAMQRGVAKRIARVKSDIYTTQSSGVDLEKLGVTSIIEPEKEVVAKIMQYVELPGLIETANFQADSIYLRSYRITEDMPIANKTLVDINRMSEDSPLLVVVIVRDRESIPPRGNEILRPGDEIAVVMPKSSFRSFRSLINRKETKMKKIVISGDSLTAIRLAEALKDVCESCILLDPSYEHGQIAAAQLNGVEVFHGDATSSDTQQEIHIESADCFIAAGNDAEDNIMASLLAKEAGTGMVIAMRNDDRCSDLFHSLGIDCIINPSDVTLTMIIEKIDLVPIGTYLKLKTSEIEIIRVKAQKNSSVIAKSIGCLDGLFNKAVTIGCIIRNNDVIIPSGKTVIEEDDEVIILCHRKYAKVVYKHFNRASIRPF
ncbi:Trk system potassium transporter TrkA [Candidatus Omnitrophota bacterium]